MVVTSIGHIWLSLMATVPTTRRTFVGERDVRHAALVHRDAHSAAVLVVSRRRRVEGPGLGKRAPRLLPGVADEIPTAFRAGAGRVDVFGPCRQRQPVRPAGKR